MGSYSGRIRLHTLIQHLPDHITFSAHTHYALHLSFEIIFPFGFFLIPPVAETRTYRLFDIIFMQY